MSDKPDQAVGGILRTLKRTVLNTEYLKASNWQIHEEDPNVLPMTAYVDYDTQKIWSNIGNDYYADIFYSRIVMNNDHSIIIRGIYKYEFVNGELREYLDPEVNGDPDYNLTLIVTKVDRIEFFDLTEQP